MNLLRRLSSTIASTASKHPSTPPSPHLPHIPSLPRRLVGIVTRTCNPKTACIQVSRQYLHPKYPKLLRYLKTYHVHDENEVCVVGDTVVIEQCPRMSKMKHYLVREIVREARRFVDPLTGQVYTSF